MASAASVAGAGTAERVGVFGVLKKAIGDFSEDDAMTHGAAVAFYTALSLAPLLLLLVWAASFLGESTQKQIVDQLVNIVGSEGGKAINGIIDGAQERPNLRSVSGIVGFATLAFGATSVFGQLQHALNSIWDVEEKPTKGIKGGAWAWIRKRILSLGMLVTLGFLLLVSLAASTALQAVFGAVGGEAATTAAVWQVVQALVSIGVFSLLFAAMFRYLPDVLIEWKDVWTGAIATSVLFVAGKFLIGMYLGRSSPGSAYGAAGSLIVLLVWVYYSALIVFLGAEVTQAWARAHGRGIQPDEHAQLRKDAKEGTVEAAEAKGAVAGRTAAGPGARPEERGEPNRATPRRG